MSATVTVVTVGAVFPAPGATMIFTPAASTFSSASSSLTAAPFLGM